MSWKKNNVRQVPVNQTYTKWMQIEFYNMTFLFCIFFLHPCTSSRFKVYTMTIKQLLFFIRQWNKTRESWRKRNASTHSWDKSTSVSHTWSICFLSYKSLYILYVDIWIYITASKNATIGLTKIVIDHRKLKEIV